MTSPTVTVPAPTTTTATAIAPSGLYVGADLDRTPYRPPRASMRGWRVAVGPPVVMMPSAATATVDTVAPALTISAASVTVSGVAEASAAVTAAEVGTNFAASPPVAAVTAQAADPATVVSCVAEATVASATADTGPVTGTVFFEVPTPSATASASTVDPTIVLAARPDVAAATAAAANPSVKLNVTLKSSASAASTSVAMPTHAAGDILIMFAARDGNTNPPPQPSAGGTVPTWNTISTGSTGTFYASRLSWAVATASNHTSGTWSNADVVAVAVMSTNNGSPIGGNAQSGGDTNTSSATAPAITLTDASGMSAILHFFAAFSGTSRTWGSVPSGYNVHTSLNGTNMVRLLTKVTTTTDGAVSQFISGTVSGFRSASVEVLA